MVPLHSFPFLPFQVYPVFLIGMLFRVIFVRVLANTGGVTFIPITKDDSESLCSRMLTGGAENRGQSRIKCLLPLPAEINCRTLCFDRKPKRPVCMNYMQHTSHCLPSPPRHQFSHLSQRLETRAKHFCMGQEGSVEHRSYRGRDGAEADRLVSHRLRAAVRRLYPVRVMVCGVLSGRGACATRIGIATAISATWRVG